MGLSSALADQRVRLIQLEWNAAADRSPVAALLGDHGYGLWTPTHAGELVRASSLAVGTDLFAAPESLGYTDG